MIRFGFTYNDPTSLRYGLPKYACPDLTNKPGYWAKALPERFCSQGTILYYFVTSSGDVHFGINGEEKGIFFSSVETRGPLWCLIDVYGNSTAIEFVDIRHQLNNSSRHGNCDIAPRNVPVERIICPMQQMSIQQYDEVLPTLRYQPPNMNFHVFPFHRTRGRNIRFLNNASIAYRTESEFCQGYVFTNRPLQIGEKIVTQVLGTEPMFQGSLGIGLTSCDPAKLTQADLPDDSNFLLDRPEYWVLSRDFTRNVSKGDEISFSIHPNGEVQISKNGGTPLVIIHVDQTLRLWAFFDIYGSTQRIRVLSNSRPISPSRSERRILSPVTNESINSINNQSEMRRNTAIQQHQSNPRVCCLSPADIQVQQGANGGAVLSVILPPAHATIINQNPTNVNTTNNSSQHMTYPSQSFQVPSLHSAMPNSTVMAPVQTSGRLPLTGTIISTCSSNYIEVISFLITIVLTFYL